VLTNFAVWATAAAQQSTLYAASLNGLLLCYTEALPYWGRTLAGDLIYSGALFGLYELLRRRTHTSAETVAA
jgi:hypothetical protein